VIKDINPAAEHHYLVLPKKHIETFLDLEPDEEHIFTGIIEAAQKIIEDNKLKSGYKIIINGGKYQLINHLHFHVLGGKFFKEKEAG
jgi:histidine triad (HIT) family protein